MFPVDCNAIEIGNMLSRTLMKQNLRSVSGILHQEKERIDGSGSESSGNLFTKRCGICGKNLEKFCCSETGILSERKITGYTFLNEVVREMLHTW